MTRLPENETHFADHEGRVYCIKSDLSELVLETVRAEGARLQSKSAKLKRARAKTDPTVKAKLRGEANAYDRRYRARAHDDPELAAKIKEDKDKDRLRDYMRRPFVAVDFEGLTRRDDDITLDGVTHPAHDLVLGGAAIDDSDPLAVSNAGATTAWLGDGKTPLTPEKLIAKLLAWRQEFQGPHKERNPIFVIFSGGYDCSQIFRPPQKGLPPSEFIPYGKRYEIIKQMKYIERDEDGYPVDADIDEDDIENMKVKGSVLWKGYAIKYLKAKYLYLGKLTDPANPHMEQLAIEHAGLDGASMFTEIKKEFVRKPDIPAFVEAMKAKYKGCQITSTGRKKLDIEMSMIIYDVYGFFQSGLTGVIENLAKEEKARFGELIANGAEQTEIAKKTIELSALKRRLAIVAKMKKLRDKFAVPPETISRNFNLRIKAYTRLELRLLARAMTVLRLKLQQMPYKGGILDLRLKSWCGAGSIAGAVLRHFEVKKNHFPDDIETGRRIVIGEDGKKKKVPVPPHQIAAQHAYFGGRIELLKMGFLQNTMLYGFDLASAYPSAMGLFPSTKNGVWEPLNFRAPGNELAEIPMSEEASALLWRVKNLKELRAAVENTCILSMFKVRWNFPIKDKTSAGEKYIPFFPLPYRVPKTKTILFPQGGYSWEMRDDILGTISWLEKFNPTWPKSGRNGYAALNFEEAFLFHPDPEMEGVRPFEFITELYEERRRLKSLPYYDLNEKIMKLGALNSVYGKLAQKVGGGYDTAPPTANPYYAAAITSYTRRRLMEAAMLDPYAIMFFATDGILSERPLEKLPRLKQEGERIELGDWEAFTANKGLFVQAGVYCYWKIEVEADGSIIHKPVTKTRGGDPKKYDADKAAHEWFVPETIAAWKTFDLAAYHEWIANPRSKKVPSLVRGYGGYATAGASMGTMQRNQRDRIIGRWAIKSERQPDGSWGPGAKRTINVHSPGPKRHLIRDPENIMDAVHGIGGFPAHRTYRLIDTVPTRVIWHNPETDRMEWCPPDKIPLSAIRPVEWCDVDAGEEYAEAREQEEIESGFE